MVRDATKGVGVDLHIGDFGPVASARLWKVFGVGISPTRSNGLGRFLGAIKVLTDRHLR